MDTKAGGGEGNPPPTPFSLTWQDIHIKQDKNMNISIKKQLKTWLD